MFKKQYLPSLITSIRFVVAFLFFYTFLNEEYALSIFLFVFGGVTDWADGYIARKMDSQSDSGAFLDVIADFVLIMVCFVAFAIKGWYDPLIILLIILMFVLFIVTSQGDAPVYDPLGKYLGAFLMVMILLSLLFPIGDLMQMMSVLFCIFCLSSIASRLIFLRKSSDL